MLTLNDERHLPQLGFGVFLVPPEEAAAASGHALETGYRAIDTAAAYRNERGVGEAVQASGLDRSDVYITTKLWNNQQGRDESRQALERSLGRLGVDYIDLYLIHWPAPENDRYVETWKTLCELHEDGRARSIGVSNFRVSDLERVIEATGVTPAVNQIELHPRFQQTELRAFHAEHGIVTESWSPLGRGGVLDDPTIAEIASAHGRTPAQAVLRWHLQLGLMVIPKSVTPSRIEENFGVFDFELSDVEMDQIAALDSPDGRIGPDPAEFNG
jgi:diketogulonate reductase-like aldo/keto reductase